METALYGGIAGILLIVILSIFLTYLDTILEKWKDIRTKKRLNRITINDRRKMTHNAVPERRLAFKEKAEVAEQVTE
jgi:hypothetical protein